MSVLEIPQQLARLEGRVAELEQQLAGQPPAADSLQPNVLTVGADGTIGADFTGHISAQGIDLPAQTGAGPDSTIDWLRPADGTQAAYIHGIEQPTLSGLFLHAPIKTGGEAKINLEADSTSDTVLRVRASPTLNMVEAFVAGKYARLLDDQGESTFLQLAVDTIAAQLAIGIGTTDVTWDGTGPLATVTGIPHELLRTPKVLLATMHAAGQGVVIACHAGNEDSNTFDLQAEWIGFTPAAGTVIPAMWAVIG